MIVYLDSGRFCIRPGKRVRIIVGNATMHKPIRHFLAIAAAFCVAIPVLGQEENPAEEEAEESTGEMMDDLTRSCISLRSLRRTEVIDDRNVLFRMRGRTVYHNILPNQCGGLGREKRFSYDSTFGRLCQGDLIRVLYSDSFGTFGMREGAGCRVGAFHKITQEDAKALKEGPVRAPASSVPLPMPAPQEVGTATEEPEDSDPE